MISTISQSSSKMRRIRQEMAELSKKLSFLTRPSLRGDTGIFSKKYFSQNYPQNIEIDSVFNADSESDISFELNRSFLTKYCLEKVSKCTKTASRKQIAQICLGWPVVLGFSKKRFVRIILPCTHSRITALSHALFEVHITLGLKFEVLHIYSHLHIILWRNFPT